MALYSFIDFGIKDFLRTDSGGVVYIEANSHEEAEEWLLTHGEDHGWTNNGVRYWNWNDEE